MKRTILAAIATLALAVPAWADVTVKQTTTGKGMILGNPHFPWNGRYRFSQQQLTIPGKYDVAGGSLIGSPAVNIGWNKNVAWSHTVSTAYRFTPYEYRTVLSPFAYLSAKGLIKHRVSEEAGRALAWTEWSACPVPNRHVAETLSAEQRKVIQTDDMWTYYERSLTYQVAPNIDDILAIWQEELSAG